MNNALHELLRGYVGIVIVFTLNTFAGQRDSLLGAVLEAAETLDAVGSEDGLAVDEMYVSLRAELLALTAAYAGIGDLKFLCLSDCKLRPYLALELIESHLGRLFLALFARKYALDELFGCTFAALLCHGGRHGRQHELMREQPDA